MSEISERYARLAKEFATTVSQVPDDKWSAPTPCPEWTARDLTQHMVDSQRTFLGFVGRDLGNVRSLDDDPLGAWTDASSAVQQELDDPERASAEFQGFAGTSTFEDAVDRFLCFDLVVHRWDLARAAGLDENIDFDDVARVHKHAESLGDSLRGPQAFGRELEPPEGADEQDRLLAFLGRRP